MIIKNKYTPLLIFYTLLVSFSYSTSVERQVTDLITQSIKLLNLLGSQRTHTRTDPCYELRGLLQRENHSIGNERVLAEKAHKLLIQYPIFQFIKARSNKNTVCSLHTLANACQKQTAYDLLNITFKLGIIASMGLRAHNQCQNKIKRYHSLQKKS